jgi:hypothetical protein
MPEAFEVDVLILIPRRELLLLTRRRMDDFHGNLEARRVAHAKPNFALTAAVQHPVEAVPGIPQLVKEPPARSPHLLDIGKNCRIKSVR